MANGNKNPRNNLYQPPHKRKQLSDREIGYLPSQVINEKFIRMPLKEKVIDCDEEWSLCGKWVVFNDGPSVQDKLWNDLQCLLGDGQCIMIKASTRKLKNEGWVILCYTLPEESRIKRAAESIRNIKQDDKFIFYKGNAETEMRQKSYRYMYTPRGRFYEKDRLNRWILVDDIYEDVKKMCASGGNEKSRNVQISSTSIQHLINKDLGDTNPSSNLKLDFFTMIFDVTDEEGRTEFETLREETEKLRQQGIFREVTYHDLFPKQAIQCFGSDIANTEIVDVIEKNMSYPYPLFFMTYNAEDKKYEVSYFQTAEGEICEPGYVLQKLVNDALECIDINLSWHIFT